MADLGEKSSSSKMMRMMPGDSSDMVVLNRVYEGCYIIVPGSLHSRARNRVARMKLK